MKNVVDIGSRAKRIVNRLSNVDVLFPVLNRKTVEKAFVEHFDRLGVEPLPVRWVEDAEKGYSAARSAAWSAAESAAGSAARSAAYSAAGSAARSAAYSAAGSAARSAAGSAARSAARSAAGSAAEAARNEQNQVLESLVLDGRVLATL